MEQNKVQVGDRVRLRKIAGLAQFLGKTGYVKRIVPVEDDKSLVVVGMDGGQFDVKILVPPFELFEVLKR